MKNKFDVDVFNNKWLVAAICFIEVLVFITIVKVRFETNDDTAMNLIASGSLTGSPSELLIFTNVSIGYLLKWLYSTTSNINWYTWYLIASFYVGYYALQFQLSKLVLQRNYKLIIHLFLLLLLLPSLQYLQFTRVAAVVLLGGFSMPQNYKKAYFLGWYVGSPFNLEKLKNYTGKPETGLYSIRNKEIVWYFRNDGYYYNVMRYHEKMQNFYKSNFKDCKITERIIPLNSKDTVFQYNVFVPN